MGGRLREGVGMDGRGWPLEALRVPSCWVAGWVMFVRLRIAASGEELAPGLRAFHLVWAACPRILALWSAVLGDEDACGLCALGSLRLVELGNAEGDGGQASALGAVS